MEDNKILLIVAITVVILLIVTGIGFFFFVNNLLHPHAAVVVVNETQTATTTDGTLPSSGSNENQNIGGGTSLEKEKQFISSFYRPVDVRYSAQITPYTLPLKDIKVDVSNYRDISRKIDLTNLLPKLSANGFVVIDNPFDPAIGDWDSGYRQVTAKQLPILVTTDSVIGLYQTTLQAIYKETEQDIFYPSLWQLLSRLYTQSKARYENRIRQVGVHNDVIAEANRLELGYVTVALKLLEAKPNQIKNSLDTQGSYFSPQEGVAYQAIIPDYLNDQVTAELKLIMNKTKLAPSPLLLYPKSYTQYVPPANYQASEKLKNYYMAITWLNDVLFPLWNKTNDCSNCLLDHDDHAINFAASLYISSDLSHDQTLKNSWANIYKAISFFKGLETNLTYLNYDEAATSIFGQNYTVDTIFNGDQKTVDANIAKLQTKIAANSFLAILSGRPDTKDHTGLRLLRNQHVLENTIFDELTGSNVGNYLGDTKDLSKLPITTCSTQAGVSRCLPLGVDLFALLKNPVATQLVVNSGNASFANYQKNVDDLTRQLGSFSENTWHDNAYLSLLAALQNQYDGKRAGFPTFMTTTAYREKSLATSLSAWTDFHHDLNIVKTNARDVSGLAPLLEYGYVEPQPDVYGQLLSNVNMVSDGFGALQLISPSSKSYERLTNLKDVLNHLLTISLLELDNKVLSADDYGFINNFNKYIRGVIGDIKADGLQNKFTLSFSATVTNKNMNEKLSGLKYMIAVYPDSTNKLFFAIGPVLNYSEGTNQGKTFSDWQTVIQP